MDLSAWITRHAQRTPERPALNFGAASIGYAALARRIDAVAGALAARGVVRGERVAWLGLNHPDLLATLFACARLGAIFVPLNWRLAPPEHRAILADCTPMLLVAEAPFAAASADADVAPAGCAGIASGGDVPAGWSGWGDFLAGARGPLVATVFDDAEAPLLLCHTSGSTGRPKGVLLSQRALQCNAANSADLHALTAADRVLTTLPLFHVGGLNIQTLPALASGATVTLHPKFDPDACLDAIEHERITLTVLVPAQLDALLAHPRWAAADLSSLRMITTGSTMVPLRLVRAIHARGVPLAPVWGATETAPIAAALHADEALAHEGTTGRAARHCAIRVVDAAGRDVPAGVPGELWVRGDNVMSGYWRDPEATARALAGGWFHSGDLGHLDAEGFLTIDGRLKDLIISGGENVSPAEVEAVLQDDPAIAEAAVVGRADARWGEVVVAVVAPRDGAALTRERVFALFDGRLARFKHPKDVVFVERLPRSALGKVKKDELRAWVAGRVAEAQGEGMA